MCRVRFKRPFFVQYNRHAALRKLPAGKFFNDLCGFNKKNKLGLKAPSIEEVKAWCAPAAE